MLIGVSRLIGRALEEPQIAFVEWSWLAICDCLRLTLTPSRAAGFAGVFEPALEHSGCIDLVAGRSELSRLACRALKSVWRAILNFIHVSALCTSFGL
jgi:hypothetical protein